MSEAVASGSEALPEIKHERTVYEVSGGRKTFFCFVFLILLPFFASLPALNAQLKLASGRGLIYRVAEKGSKQHHLPIPMPGAVVAAVTEHSTEPAGAVGGS